MKYQAVIFDLFVTLVHNTSHQENEGVLGQMATVLSIPSDDFAQLWHDTFNERMRGIFLDYQAYIKYICRKLGVPFRDTQIEIATQLRIKLVKRELTPRKDAIEVISDLRQNGYKTGLISDCSPIVPAIWPDTPLATLFDVTVFSCKVGMKKPDPRIYRLATERLAVAPEKCLYVGDGSSRELTGAAAVGMYPVLIREPDEDSAGVYRVDAERETWDGPVISSLMEVLTLLE